jgi:catenin alpha
MEEIRRFFLSISAVMPNFAQRVEVAVDALSSNPPKDVDENEFIDASRLVYDGVREIRRAVLMNRVSKILLLHAQSS